MTELFHIELGIPEHAKTPIYEGPVTYTQHALDASKTDRFGSMTLPKLFSATKARLVEVEVDDKGVCVKQVWRQRLNYKSDLVMAITRDGRVKTVWINLKSDKHTTLDRERYSLP